MEFPDKDSKRKRSIKLFIGYFLIAILVGLAALLLIYMTAGYNYDRNNGVIQNGLVFLESKPVSANIYIDNQSKGNTGARMVLNEGKHVINLKQNKYRDWSKTFTLEGGSVLYFIYPKLIPTTIKTGVARIFDNAPAWVSQSPDRNWLVLQQNAQAPVLSVIDLNKPTNEPVLNTLSATQLASVNGSRGTLSPVDWADDNRHLLLLQKMPDGNNHYVIYDRDNVDNSINLTEALKLTTGQVIKLRDGKFDKYYVHDIATGDLFSADIQKGLNTTAILKSVVSYQPYADNLILYVTYDKAAIGQANVLVLSDKTNSYMLKSLPRDANNQYLLDLAQFKGNWYYVTASVSSNRIMIYRNPLKRSAPGNKQAINPQMSLELNNPQFVSFSPANRFFVVQSAKNFIVYDAEQNRVFKYSSSVNITAGQEAKWMDGHRLNVVADQKVVEFEFDGLNMQVLTDSQQSFEPYFDKDYQFVFTLASQADGKVALKSGHLFAD
jgi:hypothetical protein